eukprot:6680295-Prorocentrum_lima.AAC.1
MEIGCRGSRESWNSSKRSTTPTGSRQKKRVHQNQGPGSQYTQGEGCWHDRWDQTDQSRGK